MDKDKLISILKSAYDDGHEDGFTLAANGVACNDFDDVLIEQHDNINELCGGECSDENSGLHLQNVRNRYYPIWILLSFLAGMGTVALIMSTV